MQDVSAILARRPRESRTPRSGELPTANCRPARFPAAVVSWRSDRSVYSAHNPSITRSHVRSANQRETVHGRSANPLPLNRFEQDWDIQS